MIPITRTTVGEEEALAVRQVILSGWVAQGKKTAEFEALFASYVGARYCNAASNCTSALHLALLAVGVQPGNIVLTVSHSFIATANAVRFCSAEPVFIDIDPDTFNMSPEDLERCLTQECRQADNRLYYRNARALVNDHSPLKYVTQSENFGRVAAIMPAHQIGIPCDMAAILSLAGRFGLPVVEDAACALGSEINISGAWEKIGRPRGDIACFSFHPRKIITTGEGGMITTNNKSYDEKIRLLKQHGMDLPSEKRHDAKELISEKYLFTGYNYRMTDMQAAMGVEQMKKLPDILNARQLIARQYHDALSTLPWLKTLTEPDYAKTNWQSYPIRISSDAPVSAEDLMKILLAEGISTRGGIMNAHEEIFYGPHRSLTNSETLRRSVVLLPIYRGLSYNEVEQIIKCIRNF
jgi:dTDP-4-amino-4,6-dideoxygalactose transaminase